MPRKSSSEKVTLVGGNKAAEVNPLGLTKKFKAVCVTDNQYLSPRWRNTKAEARADAQEHIDKGHYIDYETRITG